MIEEALCVKIDNHNISEVTTKSILDSAYKDKDFSDHNFPTPYEIVKFVESISNAKEVIVERNIEWLLDNKVSKFISECDDKQKMQQPVKK